MPVKDLSGKKFNYLTVIKQEGFVVRDKGRKGNALWLCRCECGNTTIVDSSKIQSGRKKSCGCMKDSHKTTHGMSRTATYQTWENMIQRCTNPNATKFHQHGGRGIAVCQRWLESFANFLADMGEKPDDKTLDRINNDGNYEPSNCKWATKEEQANNTRANRYFETSQGVYTMAQIARIVGVTPQSIEERVKAGTRGDDLLRPPHQGRKLSTT